MKFLESGGVGNVLTDFNVASSFCLKIVRRNFNGEHNIAFWNAAKAIQAWTSNIRFHAQFTKLPLNQEFWIKMNQPYRKLSNLITKAKGRKLSYFENCPAELADICPDDYILCPDSLLQKIYNSDMRGNPQQIDLLVTYPVQKGEQTVKQYISSVGSFTEQDLFDCCYQLLTAINDLYEKGAAHRDIKPSNILIETAANNQKTFRLIDFDASHSAEHISTAETSAFMPDDLITKKICRKYPQLESKVILDCFALAQSISCMAAESEYPPKIFPDTVPALIKQLYVIGKFDPAQIKTLLGELENKHNCRKTKCVYSNLFGCEFDFDVLSECYLGELGRYHEQICFSKVFDPLIKSSSVNFFKYNIPTELFDVLHFPLAHDKRCTYFHAPDDAETGKRPLSFHNYTPKSLENTTPTPEEKNTLFLHGKRLNETFKKHNCVLFIPEKRHIIWIDGQIKIFWGMGKKIYSPINYETYFRYLLTGDAADFSQNDWLQLLPLFPELRYKLNKKICQQLLETMSPQTVWLFSLEQFRKHAAEKINTLSPHCLIEMCQYTEEFDQHINSQTAWQMFFAADGYQRGKLLKHPQIKEMLRNTVPDLPREDYFRVFFNLRMWDEENFLRWFPQKVHDQFTVKQWEKFIAVNPEQFLRFIPEEKLSCLSPQTWVRILGVHPELINKYDRSAMLSSTNWCCILLQQPSLLSLVPESMVFSETEQKRLKKKNILIP